MRRDFGDCIGCGQPIPPPYLSFAVSKVTQEPGESALIETWEQIDVCSSCSTHLTAGELLRLVSAPADESAAA